MGSVVSVLSIVGARPQFVKAAIVSRELRAAPGFSESLLHTGQHYDWNMSKVFFEELQIPEPSYHLQIGSASHGAQTGRMMEAIEKVLQNQHPDWVLVYGDTNSTLAGALVAAKLRIPIAHVEAGLRSYNRDMPEEINRVVTDHVADLLLAPTEAAVQNLTGEGIPDSRIVRVGDVMFDAALVFGGLADQRSSIISSLQLEPERYVLATIHRAENTDDLNRLRTIVEGLVLIADQIAVVWPLHPRTRRVLEAAGIPEAWLKRLGIVNPVGYMDMTSLEKHAGVVVTDSGGVQKEAFFHQVPCVTLRTETEWVELVALGWNRLTPPISPAQISETVLSSLGQKGCPGSPYGSGDSAARIVAALRTPLQRHTGQVEQCDSGHCSIL